METQTESKYTITREEVENLKNKVQLADSDEEAGLDLFCYTHCNNDEDDMVKQCRGIVFNGDKLIMKAFSYNCEYNHTELTTLENVFNQFSKWNFYNSYEGTLLRLFYFSGRWYLSTHRKLNAFRSKWSCNDSYGTLFKRALESESEMNTKFRNVLTEGDNILEKFQNTLDKNKQYMFLLCNNTENRIVCTAPKRPNMYHVGTFVNGILSMSENVHLPVPEKLTFLNIDELVHYVYNNVNPMLLQGVVGFGPNDVQVKVLHKEYQELFRVRGNEPSVKYRYLQIRTDRNMTSMLKYLYPQCDDTFKQIENTLYDIATMLKHAYVQRYIKKHYIYLAREEHKIIDACHKHYLSDPKNNRISMERIINTLNNQPATNLNRMIRRFKQEQVQKQTEPRAYKNSPALVGLSPGLSPNQVPLLIRPGMTLPPPPKLKL
jgi:hypothetical protein